MGKYIQKSGGKRVRPAVLLMAARLGGYTGDRAVLNASVVEFIHTATLVHDDIIDGAGRPPRPPRGAFALGQRHHGPARRLPLHQVDGDGPDAGLAGDRPAALRRHAAHDRRGALPAHQDRRRRHHRGRALRDHPPQDRATCSAAAPRSAPCSAASPRSRSTRCASIGFNLGIAFQLVDDLLDYTADESALGKPDRRRPARGQGHAADHLPPPRRRRRGRSRDPQRRGRPRGDARSSGATSSRCCASRTRPRWPTPRPPSTPTVAKRSLDIFPPSREREALVALADYVLSRDR